MTAESKTISKRFIRRIAVFIAEVFVATVLLTRCIYDKEFDYLYTVGIENHSYTGNSLPGPMNYLSGLNIADRFTITAESETDADAQARSRFETEMSKIDPAAFDVCAAGEPYRFRYVLRPEGCTKMLAEREFTSREDAQGCFRRQ